jgi:hypothetical protein
MRWIAILVGLGLLAAVAARADSARVVKVLPYYLDQQGHHALRPSLYERDAYQSLLRRNPALVSTMRFDVQWKASGFKNLTLRIEARGTKDGQPQQTVVETPAKRKGLFGCWTSAVLPGEAYRKLGQLNAWRATLWSEGRQVAEQMSFLW